MQTKKPFDIFIPSKGRPNASLFSLIKKEELHAFVVIEPADADEYFDELGDEYFSFIVLPKSNQGIAYARQFILELARNMKLPYYWQIDDNIRGYKININGKLKEYPMRKALIAVESFAQMFPNVALASHDYQQFAFRYSKDLTFTRAALCSVLTRTDTEINYDPSTEMKEDIDFTIQHLTKGYQTFLFHRICMDKAVMGKNTKGGLAEKYRAGKHRIAAKRIVEKWADIASLRKKELGIDVSINWKLFSPIKK